MELPALVCRYADRFAALGRGEQHVSSPLGAWLVLALVAPAATGELADQIVDALGTDAVTAHQAATDLLTQHHPVVRAAVAAWTEERLTGLDEWRAGLPRVIMTGPIPTQRRIDSWARTHTLGLIEKFPVDIADAVIVLASALAAKASWAVQFETADAAHLRGPWSTELTRVLVTPRGEGHHTFIADTARAGRVAVHTARADDLDVTSVVADPAVRPADVLAAAHEISARLGEVANEVSLNDLPLGEHPLWTITEERHLVPGDEMHALMPAWHAVSSHDLLEVPELAFGAAGEVLRRLAGIGEPIKAGQRAVARYSQSGFEAAAVTYVVMEISDHATRLPGLHRKGIVRFGHPYAVVATARGRNHKDPWHGLPVFAAWITRPDDARD